MICSTDALEWHTVKSEQNKSKYGTERATVGKRITIASKIGLFVLLDLLAK